jgi:hypothetical protein
MACAQIIDEAFNFGDLSVAPGWGDRPVAMRMRGPAIYAHIADRDPPATTIAPDFSRQHIDQ